LKLEYTHRKSKFGTGVPVVKLYASIHAGNKAFAEQPLGTAEI